MGGQARSLLVNPDTVSWGAWRWRIYLRRVRAGLLLLLAACYWGRTQTGNVFPSYQLAISWAVEIVRTLDV